ncbi:type I DNA topoisomerase [Pantanalinema sp. GBBB05]|uniref:type I DNA topoisomerase n=1 Tax=Pantanalinema sp. GBBB05 TaxID=2604139 RepID=UPI001E19BA3F|nr:type I DNA topoisomerase [Pantanalinema sp. GBBB05]
MATSTLRRSSVSKGASRGAPGKPLLIIEAPGKLAKLRHILGDTYQIQASGGHIRELANDGDAQLGFDLVDDRIHCRWEPRGSRGKKAIAELRAAAQSAQSVILATDEDREGETIGWHIAQALGLKNIQRITYREITPAAVRAAIAKPRPINLNLVHAGICRSVLDKLVGYRGSPLVWALHNGAKSIGRVQSATLHLVVERELKIRHFQPQDYWNCYVDYQEGFRAFYARDNKPNTAPTDPVDDAADPAEKQAPESDRVLSQAEADRLIQIARQNPHRVISCEGKIVHRKPPAPFTTSTLQQAAGSKLKFPPEKTMQLAQGLYEKGIITYHRSDSVYLSPEFVQSVHSWLADRDPSNVPSRVTHHQSRKTAQEAHEAIRPTDVYRSSDSLRAELDADAFALYVMIWKRTVASLCQSARVRQTRIVTQSGDVQWQAKGQVVEFEGFAKYWRSLGPDTELPIVQPEQALTLEQAAHEQKQTQPPPRYSEAQLVALMERKGIGRPSTYAPTIQTLKQRDYVGLVKGKLQATEVGEQVDRFLVQALPKLVDIGFTAEMESSLDQIAQGKLNWEHWLTSWNRDYFAPALEQAKQMIPSHLSTAAPVKQATQAQVADTACPQCHQLMVQLPSKKVKKGYFLKCQGCTTVMFWSDRSSTWEQPRPLCEQTPAKLTEHLCPICQMPLEEYFYQKAGQEKVMLRCSDRQARQQSQHEGAVYFQTANGFWSPRLGELHGDAASKPPAPKSKRTSASKSRSRKR